MDTQDAESVASRIISLAHATYERHEIGHAMPAPKKAMQLKGNSAPKADLRSMDLSMDGKRVRIRILDGTHRPLVLVMDSKTNEVIREIPPEELRELAARLEENPGLVLDQEA